MEEITGMNWSSCSARTTAASMRVMSPTKPMSSSSPGCSGSSISFLRAWIRQPSLPVRPTALPPAALIIMTMSCCTWPPSTHSTTSMVSASVTRMPWTKVPSLPMRLSAALICGPPPCTTTGLMPTSLSSTTSCAKLRCRCSSVMALPPYLMTTVLPGKRRMYGRASERTAALTVAECWGSELVMSFLMSAQCLVHGCQEGFFVVVAQIATNNVALFVDQECCRSQAHVAELAGNLAIGVDHDLEGQFAGFREILYVIGRIILHGNGDGVVATVFQGVVVLDVVGHLRHTGDTAGGPELDQDHLATEILRGELLARQCGERDVGRGLSRTW